MVIEVFKSRPQIFEFLWTISSLVMFLLPVRLLPASPYELFVVFTVIFGRINLIIDILVRYHLHLNH